MSLHALQILRFRSLSVCVQLVSLSFVLNDLGEFRLKLEPI